MGMYKNVDVIEEVKKLLKDSSKDTGLTTGQVRRISATAFKLIENKDIDNVLNLSEELLKERRWELGVVAYDWAFRVKKQYREEHFNIFETWLENYVTGWGDCDDFCTHAFGELLRQYNNLFTKVVQWTKHPDFWVRRAAAVILIYPIKKGGTEGIDPFKICDSLMNDDHHLVLKGYGWMLKVLSTYKEDEVYEYLIRNKDVMPRVSLRYAIEKFSKDKREVFMTKQQ